MTINKLYCASVHTVCTVAPTVAIMALSPRESGKFISSTARNVFIDNENIKWPALAFVEAIENSSFSLDKFLQCEFHPRHDDPLAVDWIFVLDTLNFSFWTATGSKKWTVNGQTGYFALCAAVKRAIEEGKPIQDPAYYSKITLSDVETIFRGDDEAVKIPLIHERVQVLHEAGKVLLSKYEGTFETCIKSCKRSAMKLLDLIIGEFKAYRDEAVYEGEKVSFYKRAQILIGDIWTCFKGRGIGEFHDINSITMFADYRIPQVFLYVKAFRYSDSLLKKLQSDELLENGSREEVEIRGCSIELVERICEEVERLLESSKSFLQTPEAQETAKHVNAIMIDQFLWDYRRRHAKTIDERNIPFHKTRCIYY
ncbi:queuosine salvage protein [Odontomachus brunneus]|uniref:queuosine salvage protein n=1 Tax=Odontomachus brunneus TaxID=486640 RepID=UPI0013F25E76|nr:queuosine salvage protein [Odontomachus brunneus]